MRVCFAGLEQQSGLAFPERIADWPPHRPPNLDLLAHAVKYAAEINAPELESLLDLTGYDAKERKGRSDWPWRAFLFIMDGLASVGRADEAIDLAYGYLAKARGNPDQQKVVSNLAGIMSARGERTAAVKVLKDWLRTHPNLPAAQVVARLIDWEQGSETPEQIIDWANRGIRDLAEEQPSVNLGTLVYSRALAQDWHAHTAAAQSDGSVVAALARAALTDYKLARETNVSQSLYGQIDLRCKLLRALLVRYGSNQSDIAATGLDEGNVQDEDGGDLVSSANSAFQQVIRMLSFREPDAATYGATRKLLDELPEIARSAVRAHLLRVAEDSDCPEMLRDKLRWFLERYEKE